MIYNSSWSNRFEIKPGRWVYNPSSSSRKSGENVLKTLNKSWRSPSYYYHLRSGGHVEALSVHLQNNFFSTIDIADFFGYISRSRITRALKKIISYEKAREIAKLSTVKVMGNYPHSHHLPYGFIQSPLLASICLADSALGIFLEEIYKNNLATVSVYMDDIVISSNDESALNNIYDKLIDKLEKSKFLINDKKSNKVSEKTTAFNIEIYHNEMKIEYERFVKFQRAYSLSNSDHQKKGIGSYVGSVNKKQSKLLI
ncbi:hypothetical protein H5079_04455 [Pseudoalteromonas sp. SG44-5]|uniref:reverse transcriptase domain-containing protein n=1 Tax=Pseudoalteromonas sp. SG44-5 TaxID=2760960 RepID=UPI0015FCD3CF|nr:reverse transcriptase domain-containing protein [Pseudoalteromonas sp. SG44-5]MBB1404861.1 hypothetical protein [Pseudoalteromonas sp. SG44-5]